MVKYRLWLSMGQTCHASREAGANQVEFQLHLGPSQSYSEIDRFSTETRRCTTIRPSTGIYAIRPMIPP